MTRHALTVGLFFSRLALLTCVVSIAGAAPADTPSEDMKAARKKAAWKPRPIIYNNDGNDTRPDDEPTRENFLKKRAVPLAKSKAKTQFYCTGIWGTFTFPSPVAELRDGRDRGVNEWAAHLNKDGGPDSLGTMIEFCHARDIEVFWSLRMNDTHDAKDPSMLNRWKKAHPEMLLGKHGVRYPAGGRRWSAANYEKKEVRDRVVSWIEDVGRRYDVEGFELDFFRHPIFFKPQLHGKPVSQEQCDMMTSLMRRIREAADREGARRGRPLLIAVRVPDSVGYCRAIGLDVERWLKEDLVDMMTVSGYFRLNPWKTSVDLGHKYNVPVFAGLSEPRWRRDKNLQQVRKSIECYRARALDAWQAGVDGIYLFNYYFDPSYAACNDLGDPEALLTMDKLVTTGSRQFGPANSWLRGAKKYLGRSLALPDRPKTLTADKPARVTLDVHDQVAENKGTVMLRLYTPKLSRKNRLKVTVNGHRGTGGSRDGAWSEFLLEPGWIKKGKNQFSVSLVKPENGVLLRDLLLWIRYDK